MADDDHDRGGIIQSWTSRPRCVQNTTLCVVLLFFILICVMGIAWLIKKPQEPSIRVSSVSVSNFSVSDSQLTGTYDIGFKMSNPNKKIDMFLDEFSLWIYYDKVELAHGTVQDQQEATSLKRTKEKNLTVHVVMKVDSSPKLRKKKVFAELEEEWRRKVVKFNVSIEVSLRFESGNWPTTTKLLDLNCGNVFFRDDAGKLVGNDGGNDDCQVL